MCAYPTTAVIDGIGTPVSAARPLAGLMALVEELEQSQWWPEQALEQHQRRQLGRLLDHAWTIPFYRGRLTEAGYRPGREITPEFWRSLPVLTRREVQAQGRALLAPSIPPEHGPLEETVTSGATGTPVKVVKTGLDRLFWCALRIREELWQGLDLRLKMAVIRGFAAGKVGREGIRLETWDTPVADLFPTGALVALDIRTPVAEQAAWLVREKPDYLLTFPSNLVALLNHFRERGCAPPPLRAIRTMSEVVDRRLRRLCREAWGVEVVDLYSAEEAGYIAIQCPRHTHYHVQSETVLLEVLDARGNPCGPGETGVVVVTPLHNVAMPLIRYALGDYAELGGPCPCGRGLPVIARILGRAKDNVILPSGEERHAWLGTREFAEIDAIVQHQVVQKSLGDIEVRLVVKQPLAAEEEDRLRQILGANLGPDFCVAFRYLSEIPRAPSGKFYEFLSELAPRAPT
ncbi:MAG: phenylacetate--CoA ligase family protein [Stellaceae bacterium]